MAKQFGFQQLLRYRGRIDRNKGPTGPRAIITVACDCDRRPIARKTSCIDGAWPSISGTDSLTSPAVSWRTLSSIARRISSTA
jgi:hypothetical protein